MKFVKCSECGLCVVKSNNFFKCGNRKAKGYGLEIFNPENAGCERGEIAPIAAVIMEDDFEDDFEVEELSWLGIQIANI